MIVNANIDVFLSTENEIVTVAVPGVKPGDVVLRLDFMKVTGSFDIDWALYQSELPYPGLELSFVDRLLSRYDAMPVTTGTVVYGFPVDAVVARPVWFRCRGINGTEAFSPGRLSCRVIAQR